MTEYFLEGRYSNVELHHIRMAFSVDLDQVGRAEVKKLGHLLLLLGKIFRARWKFLPDVLYFPPAGPKLVPFLRDCAILILTRPFFPKTVFHFHAAGLPGLHKRLSAPLKLLFRTAYGNPDLAIVISKDGLRDSKFLGARKTALVPNGIPDIWQRRTLQRHNARPQILFLAMVCEEKGVGVLLDACHRLKSKGFQFTCKIAGRAPSSDELAKASAQAAGLEDIVEFVGPVAGDEKWLLFEQSDIFCFPTHYSSESFGLVAVEAMMTGLPIVTTNWRALPEIVVDGSTGFVTPIKDAHATATKLERLLSDPLLRQAMGKAARERYLERYGIDVFREGMENALSSLTD
jgi:glycosyltransferase involved in cell wall biosynthesis